MLKRIALSILLALGLAFGAFAQGLQQAVPIPLPQAMGGTGTNTFSGTRTLSAKTVNFGATGDQATIAVPTNITKYLIEAISITNCSAVPVLAQPALYTAAAAGGTNLVAAAVITGATSATVSIAATLAGTVATTTLTATPLYVRVVVANATALTCDVFVSIRDFS